MEKQNKFKQEKLKKDIKEGKMAKNNEGIRILKIFGEKEKSQGERDLLLLMIIIPLVNTLFLIYLFLILKIP